MKVALDNVFVNRIVVSYNTSSDRRGRFDGNEGGEDRITRGGKGGMERR